MKTKEEFLIGVQFPNKRSPRDFNMTLLAMQEYAEQYHTDQLRQIDEAEVNSIKELDLFVEQFLTDEEIEKEEKPVIAVEEILNPGAILQCHIGFGNDLDGHYESVIAAMEEYAKNPEKEEIQSLHNDSAELRSLKQSIYGSRLKNYFPKREMSFHDKVISAIFDLTEQGTE